MKTQNPTPVDGANLTLNQYFVLVTILEQLWIQEQERNTAVWAPLSTKEIAVIAQYGLLQVTWDHGIAPSVRGLSVEYIGALWDQIPTMIELRKDAVRSVKQFDHRELRNLL
jgi:hypothetical protein